MNSTRSIKDEEGCIGSEAAVLEVPPPPSRPARLHAHLQTEVTDPSYQLAWACFLSGFTSAIVFSSNTIWIGFQT